MLMHVACQYPCSRRGGQRRTNAIARAAAANMCAGGMGIDRLKSLPFTGAYTATDETEMPLMNTVLIRGKITRRNAEIGCTGQGGAISGKGAMMGRLDDIRARRESSADIDWLLTEYDKQAALLKRTKAISLLMLSVDEDSDEETRLYKLLAQVIEATRWIQFMEAGLQVVYALHEGDMTNRLPLYIKLQSGDSYTGEDLSIEKLKATARLLRSIDYLEGFSPVNAEG